jgi:hypothetical protein
MVDTQTMAMFHGIQNLEKGPSDKRIIVHIPTSFRDIREEVSLWAIFKDNVGAIGIVDNLEHGHNIGMC